MTESLNKITYACPECSMTFLRPESFKKHMKTMHLMKIVVCSSCPLYFDELGKLFLHARQIHKVNKVDNQPTKRHQCQYEGCFYQTDNGGLFRHHMRSHLNLKPFTCIICNKKFTQKSNMKTHFNRHKKNNFLFNCDPCEKQFNSHDTYLSHLETREHQLGAYNASKVIDVQCMTCLLKFNCPEEIYAHVSDCQTFGDFPISCELCFVKLPHDLETIKEHLKNHKNEIICPFCPEFNAFKDKMKFNLHLTKIHNEKVTRRPVCRYCEQPFKDEKERNQHINEEHQELKNKHNSRNDMGRIICSVKECTFSTNSQIQAQAHFLKHFGKNTNKDLYYQIKMDEQPVEETENIVKQRKRGRPRLCDEIPHSENSAHSIDNSFENVKRKRGRPKKVAVDEQKPINEMKTRGRPRKNRESVAISEIPMKLDEFDVKDSTDYNIDEFEKIYNSEFNSLMVNHFDDFKGNMDYENFNVSQSHKIKEEPEQYCFDKSYGDINFDAFNDFEEFNNLSCINDFGK